MNAHAEDRLAFVTAPSSALSSSSTAFARGSLCVRGTSRSLPLCSPRRHCARIVALGPSPSAASPSPADDDAAAASPPAAEEGAGDAEQQQPSEEGIDEVTADDILNSPTFLKKKLEVLQRELDEAKCGTSESDAALQEEQARYVRLVADFDNYRRRSVEDLRKAETKAVAKVCKEILTVLDNFERAGGSVTATTDNEKTIVSSFQSINKQLLDALTKLKVTPIDDCVGQLFDPELHEAIQRQDSEEFHEDVVSQQFSRGYKIDETLIRAAVVAVSVGPGPEGVPPPTADEPATEEEQAEATDVEAEAMDVEAKEAQATDGA